MRVENDNFNRLSAGLSLDERLNLLKKLNGLSNLSSEPLYIVEPDGMTLRDMAEQYDSLSWTAKLWIALKAFFSGRSPYSVYEEQILFELGRKIEGVSPNIYDPAKGKLLPLFYENLEKLRDAARFFSHALEVGVYRDKGAFCAFLGSLEMAPIHGRLMEGAGPEELLTKNPNLPLHEVKKLAYQSMEDAFTYITEDYRSAMYFNIRSLLCLRQLSSFLFDRLMLNFTTDASIKGKTCSAGNVKDLLITLNNVLFSLKNIPPMPLLESLFVFLLQENSAEKDFDMEKEIRKLLQKAEAAIGTIREFNRRTSLTRIIRCASKDMTLEPREIPGGEDWFMLYRDYWKRQIDNAFATEIRSRRYENIMDSFRNFLKGRSPKPLANAASDQNPDGIPVKWSFGLSFLLTFHPVVFMAELNPVLKPILVNGEFVRRENKQDFLESYNVFSRLENEIRNFEAKISMSGDYEKRYTLAKQEVSALPVKRRKVQIVLEEASSEAADMINVVRKASRNLIDAMNGIMGREVKGVKISSLSNLEKITGSSPAFFDGISNVIKKLQTLMRILDEIEEMEIGS